MVFNMNKNYNNSFIHDEHLAAIPDYNYKYQRQEYSYVVSHLREIEFIRELEDENKCSGICKPSLFYYGLNIDKGSPKETCLIHLKNTLSS